MSDRDSQPRTGAFRAVVRAGADETPYQQAGNGKPIVLVWIRAIDDPECQALVTALALSHRVYVPGIKEAPRDFAGWLGLLLDGIGLDTVALVVAETMATQAVGFAVQQPERVEALVVLSGAEVDATTEVSGTRLLTLGRGRSAGDAASVIGRFLG